MLAIDKMSHHHNAHTHTHRGQQQSRYVLRNRRNASMRIFRTKLKQSSNAEDDNRNFKCNNCVAFYNYFETILITLNKKTKRSGYFFTKSLWYRDF